MSVVVTSPQTTITVSHKGGTVVVSKPSNDIVVAPSITIPGTLGLVTGDNVGGGDAEVFRDKIGTVFNFRTFSGIDGIAVSENGDVVEVDGSALQTVLLSHNTRHQHGGADEVATATPAANAIPKADGTGKLDSGWMPTGTFTLAAVSTADTTPGFLNDKIVAGAGLTSSILNPAGDEDLQLNIGANLDGSIVVGSDDIQVGVLATDAQHGNRGGGSIHALAVASGAAGFLSGTDKQTIDDLGTTYAPLVHASRHAGAGADPITSLGSVTFTGDIVANTKIGIGTATIPHGSIGGGVFAIDGADGSLTGPHVQYTTFTDNYPLFQLLNWSHDNVTLCFDSYYAGSGIWRSSDSGSNFQIRKYADKFRINYASGKAQGATIGTWNDGLILDTSGDLQLFGMLQFGGQTNTEPAWKVNSTSPGPCLESRLADDSGQAYLRAYHLGLNRDPTTTHLVIASESFATTGNVIGYGCFPEYAPTSSVANIITSIQGNTWFSTTNWGSSSRVQCLDFYPAPLVAGTSFGSANLDISSINTAGLLNILGRTITANTITGIAVTPITNIFAGTDNTTCNIVRGIYIYSAAATTGTWGRLCGLEIEPQTSGTVNQGLAMKGDGTGCDIVFGAGFDANMFYDGSNLIIDPDLVGTGLVLIGTTGDDDMLLNSIEIDGTLDHDGALAGFRNATPIAAPGTWTITNHTSDRTMNCNVTTINELADIVGQIILDLINQGLLAGSVT